jgi:phosphoribosylformylglycinamidine synthase
LILAEVAYYGSFINIVWAPIKRWFRWNFISANWMWACKTKEKTLVCTLRKVVQFCNRIGNQYSNRKRLLSMKQKYPNEEVIAPGTVLFQQVEIVPILEK